jgi:hypothetical protein
VRDLTPRAIAGQSPVVGHCAFPLAAHHSPRVITLAALLPYDEASGRVAAIIACMSGGPSRKPI